MNQSNVNRQPLRGPFDWRPRWNDATRIYWNDAALAGLEQDAPKGK